ncbi:MAG TPA: peptidylprolyl isomerase [Crinalium sp.]|jgi:parvulin-like peptidyl-prolyl isomerase
MQDILPISDTASKQPFTLPEIPPATPEDILKHLQYSRKIAEIAKTVEREQLIVKLCEELNITVSDEELQSAGDAFRLEHKLLTAADTIAWLNQQRITVEDWSYGIRIERLTQKLKEHVFGGAIDAHYMSDRDQYKRVALSQILLPNEAEAIQVLQELQNNPSAFCALALQHSRGKQSKNSGGFIGVQFVMQLPVAIREAIANAQAGEIIGPVYTQLGYHVLKIEMWFPPECSESVRQTILDSLFENWLS